MRKLGILLAFGLGLVGAACAGADDDMGEDMGSSHDEIRVSKSFVAKGTGYFPDSSAMEGGFVDRKGAKLRTLQQFIDGKAEYVSVAMDTSAFPYGQRLRINELNTKYKKEIVFRVVDTGGAFKGKGTSRIDICTASSKASSDATVNGTLHIDVIDEKSGPPEIPTAVPGGSASAAPSATTPPPSTTTRPPPTGTTPPPAVTVEPPPPPPPSSNGPRCGSDGACNPGNDGSGLICVSSQCVPGCRSNAQCPGITTCKSGQCK